MSSNYDIIAKGSCSFIISECLPYDLDKMYITSNIKFPCSKMISKIFNEEHKYEFYTELEILKQVTEIPNYDKFTVPIFSAAKCKSKTEPMYQIVMEYGGIPINKIRKNMTYDCFVKLITDFYYGLQKLHEKGIVHRDIKPPNLLMDYDKMQFNIIDFGIACKVEDVYKKDDDNYILSYRYMYHPPEFYAASLLYDNMKNGHDFVSSVDMVHNVLTNYGKELETFYMDHYYKYNNYEVYNMYSYKEAFSEFFATIKEQNYTCMSQVFTHNMAYKSDVYASSFLLKSLKRHIIFENIDQRKQYNELFNMAYSLNPFNRKSVVDIIAYLTE